MQRLVLGLSLGLLALALPLPAGVFRALPWIALGVLALAGWRIARQPSEVVLSAALAAGLLWGWHAIVVALDARVPECADADYQTVRVEVVSRPERQGRGAGAVGDQPLSRARFEAEVMESSPTASTCGVAAGSRLRLTWYAPPDLAPGQRWQLTARVRPPWGYRNPAGFDFERWLLGRGIQGTGWVRSGTLLETGSRVADGFEAWLLARGARHPGVVLALTRGDSSGIGEATWEALRSTGTVHLLVVSGLHVGLVCGATFFAVAVCLRLAALVRPLETEPAAVLAALAMGAGFVIASGGGLPAIRAWTMTAGLLLLRIGGWRCAPGAVLLLALMVVLVLDPLAVHQSGAYLSFAAVAALLLHGVSRVGTVPWLLRLPMAQLVLFVGLAPPLAAWQGEVPGVGVLANLVAVPLLTVLLPVLLVTLACWREVPDLAAALLVVGDRLLDVLFATLRIAGGPLLDAPGSGPLRVALGVLAAALILPAGTDRRVRALLLPIWLAWLAPTSSRVPDGEFRVTALDVGQGSALLVDTRDHRLLFDAGPAFPGGFDLGEAVVVPSVRVSGAGRLDALVLSHADTDHTGGAAAVLRRVPVRRTFSPFPPTGLPVVTARAPANRCEDGIGWRWDGVEFRFLHPRRAPWDAARPDAGDDNDTSCVLRVSTGSRTLLLTGDIGRRAERRLVRSGALLAADVVTAPHHGSATSSSAPWVAATRPRFVLISAPRRSRYGHPDPAIVARYEAQGVRVWVTGRDGALVWETWRPRRLRHLRDALAPYWVNRYPPAAATAGPDGG